MRRCVSLVWRSGLREHTRVRHGTLGNDGPTDRTSWSWRPALEDGGGTGKDRGGDLVVRGPAANTREVLDVAGLAALVDEVETTEVEMTHD
jgi:hypothetical protein